MSTDPFETSAASYVLGALAPAERARFVRHLAGCADCRARVDELAGLPGLLGRVPMAAVEALDRPDQGPPGVPRPDVLLPDALLPDALLPDTLLPRLLAAAAAGRRRRRVVVALGSVAAVAVVLAVLTGLGAGPLAPPTGTGAAPTRSMTVVAPVPITADVGLQPVGWGTRITLRCTYSATDGRSRPYELVVVGADGSSQAVGTWTGVPGRTVDLSAATSLGVDAIAAVEIRSATGTALLRLRPGGSGGVPSGGS